LTSQLLAFARGGKYNVTPVNINKMVLDTLGIIQSTFDKSIIVEKDLEQNIPTVEADPGQMQQVVMNLCVNARDAMPGGGILRVETSEVELTENDTKSNIEAHPGRYVLLIVSDTGIGMDKQTVRRIFEPFFTTKEKGKGTGLGLSMVYGIVRNHGGFIRVESEPGKGTSFEVFYPASRKAEKKEAGAMEEVKGGSETILVAEDEDAMRELVTDILESGGYNVIAAENGEAAVEAYTKRKDEISLVILDMIMPKMNGSEAFKNLKRINPDVLVLLSSGYSQDGAAQELLNEGVAGFLGKPYQVRELLEKVRAVLEKGKST
ncbi:MAG: response regulator, partial [Bacteroidetes bacterium]|nr:response regulator [Bacteroidota bacterium]MCL5738682.1 response regulator [Bacteroidota bacterium]